MLLSFMIPFFAIWGSFLNMLGYRLIHDDIPFSQLRSCCPACKQAIAPYDLIPIVSWLLLRGKCRNCTAPISKLYPCIEIITVIALLLLFVQCELTVQFFAYTLFFSALIVTIRTDLDQMLISQYATWALVPIGWILSYLEILPISLTESVIATVIGYASLWMVNTAYKALKKIDGIGAGDFDLLALIGSWIGLFGLWATITIGAFSGSIAGIILFLINKDVQVKIPFGPFLALGAMLYVLYLYSIGTLY